MKITKANSAFKPVTITLETRDELICMRAVADAASRDRKISQTFIDTRLDRPFTGDAKDFARELDLQLASEEWT